MKRAADRAAEVIRAAGDPGAPVPGLTWTVAETAAHLVNEFRDYTAYAQGTKQPTGSGPPSARNATANTAQLDADPDRDLVSLADRLTTAVDAFLRLEPRAEPVPVSNGLAMNWATMTSALLGELLIHGLDIARASHRPWRIDRADALQVIAGVMTMLPDYLDRSRASGLRTTYELRLRGGPRYVLKVADGRATVGEGRPDCWISADPVAFLEVGFGRSSQLGQILRGRLVAGGRKPWRATSFGQIITGP